MSDEQFGKDWTNDWVKLWTAACLISVGRPLHRFVPKEPGWCQVIGNKVDWEVRRAMGRLPYDDAHPRAVVHKHMKRLLYVYNIAARRREEHLAIRRQRRQAKLANKKPELTIIDGGRHD